jgi:hypothetical protein
MRLAPDIIVQKWNRFVGVFHTLSAGMLLVFEHDTPFDVNGFDRLSFRNSPSYESQI